MSNTRNRSPILRSARKQRKHAAIIAGLGLAVLVLTLVSLSLGSVRIPLGDVVQALFSSKHPSRLILIELRLPRIVGSMLIGSALAVSGALLQGVIRNPLAAPDLLGVTGGASVAVVAFMTTYAGVYSIHWVPFIAIAGAFVGAAINYMLAWKGGITPFRLVLIGLGISTAMAALTTFLLLNGPAYLAIQVLNWMTGTIYGTSWKHVAALLPWVAVFLPLSLLYAKELNVQALGDSLATGLGSRLQLNRLLLLLFSVALAGAAVGTAGMISFIGLLAPHMARRLVGSSHGVLLPAAALVGALVLMLADLAGRTLFMPLDVPAGVFTAGIGAPFFLYLLYKRR